MKNIKQNKRKEGTMEGEFNLKHYYTTSQFMELVGISYYWLWMLIKRKKLKAVKYEGRWYIPKEELKKFVDER